MNDLQQQYNNLLQNYRKALDWIDDKSRDKNEIEKWQPKYLEIVNQLKEFQKKLNLTPEETVNGFKEAD